MYTSSWGKENSVATLNILRFHSDKGLESLGMTYIQVLLIYFIDDLQMSRKQPLHQLHWPALQGFWEHSVVGVGEGLLSDLPRLWGAEGQLLCLLCGGTHLSAPTCLQQDSSDCAVTHTILLGS